MQKPAPSNHFFGKLTEFRNLAKLFELGGFQGLYKLQVDVNMAETYFDDRGLHLIDWLPEQKRTIEGYITKEDVYPLIIQSGFRYCYEIECDMFDYRRMIFFNYNGGQLEISYDPIDHNSVTRVLHAYSHKRERIVFDIRELKDILTLSNRSNEIIVKSYR